MKLAGLACSCLVLAASARAELQLKPSPSSYEVDGVRFPQLSFTDGNKEVHYVPPAGWESAGSESKLVLHPKGKIQAEATVIRIPLKEEASFDEETMKKLADQALASVPSGATNVKLLSQDKNTVMINTKETYLVTMSYTWNGDTYGRSVMYMNRGKEQLRFQLISRLADFNDLQRAFHQSHFTWQNL